MVHDKTIDDKGAFLPGTIKGSLRRGHIVAAQGSESGVHHVTDAAVIGIGAVAIVHLHRDNIHRDAVIMDLYLVDGCQSDCPASCLSAVIGVQQRDRRAARLVHLVIG